MIRKTSSFARALAILSILESDERLAYGEGVTLAEAYQNGREQGILLWGFKDQSAFYVAEHRNSDRIVVYQGQYHTQSISEDAYQHPAYFDTVDEAVEYLAVEIINLREQESAKK